jgi:ribonuclease BN (tRNA processing enzyme)
LVRPGSIEIGGFRVSVQPLNHPGGAFAYRVHGDDGDVVYATDHEFGNIALDEELAAFCLNASAVISDAHFTPEELPDHKGWGHASWRQVAEFAAACRAGPLWLFHHKPGRTDQDLTAIEAEARRVFPATTAAKEGASFEI